MKARHIFIENVYHRENVTIPVIWAGKRDYTWGIKQGDQDEEETLKEEGEHV